MSNVLRGQMSEFLVIDGCEAPHECWKPNLGPQQEQWLFYTISPATNPKKLIKNLTTQQAERLINYT